MLAITLRRDRYAVLSQTLLRLPMPLGNGVVSLASKGAGEPGHASTRTCEIVGALEIDPELRRRPESRGEQERRLRGDPRLPLTISFTRWIGMMVRELNLCEPNGFRTPQRRMCGMLPWPRVNRSALSVSREALFPAKDDSPLIVHSDAVKPLPVALQRLQPVAGRRLGQVCQDVSRFDHVELSLRRAQDVRAKPSGPGRCPAVVDLLGHGIPEGERSPANITRLPCNRASRSARCRRPRMRRRGV